MMISIATQTLDELGGPDSLLARQRRDHVELERLLVQVRGLSGRDQDEALGEVYRLAFPHAFAEESVIWPAVRRAVLGGDELTLQNEIEHQKINELVSSLERTHHDDPRRPALVDAIVSLLRDDVRDEEDIILPRLQAAVSADALRRLGRTFDLVRRVAPTRAHAIVSRRPPGNVVAALPLTVIDRTRDVMERRARDRGTMRGLAGRASRWLGSAAVLVERAPPMRRGESPRTRSPGASQRP